MRALDDTICAVATPPGEGGIAIVRVSGPRALDVARGLLRKANGSELSLEPRYATLANVVTPGNNRIIDEVIALLMVAPRSYTREDVLELQCHGGRAAANAVLEAMLAMGIRLAEPGEFTLRAFLRGRIDLIQAEAVADIIHAQTADSLKIHEGLLQKKLSEEVSDWQRTLGDTLVHLESFLDFPEEELELQSAEALTTPLKLVANKMKEKLESYSWGRTAREGFRVAILGLPNVGKSSLLNLLAEEERAIVSPVAGTTRDTIEVKINALGAPIHLVDTAGLRASADEIENEGVIRARRAASEADLLLMVFDGSRDLTPEEREEARTLAEGGSFIAVINKSDLDLRPSIAVKELLGYVPLKISAISGEGVEELLRLLRERAWAGEGPTSEEPLTRLRHRNQVAAALERVEQGIALLETTEYADAAANELQSARRELASLLGWGTPEEIVDKIFEEFCIGK